MKSLLIILPEQLSVKLTRGTITSAPQVLMSAVTFISAGQVISGASSSLMLTFIEHVEVFPAISVAVKVTIVIPIGYVPLASAPPALKSFVIPRQPQLSLQVTIGIVTAASQEPISAVWTISTGQEITGSSVSSIITDWVCVVVCNKLSV